MQTFLDSILVNKRNWEAVATFGFISIFSLGWIMPKTFNKAKHLLFLASLLPIIYYVALRLSTDYAMTAYMSFSSRTLSGLILPGLILLAIIVANMGQNLSRVGVGSFTFGLTIMLGFNLADLRHWVDVKDQFHQIANTDQKYVSIDETSLKDNQYRWSWNNSLLSIVWSGSCVRTIVLNNPDGPQGPINPRTHLVLKRYLNYDSYFRKVDADIVVCDS